MTGGRGGASRATGDPGGGGEPAEVRIRVTSGYGARSRLPFVDVSFEQAGGEAVRYQISPDEARRAAMLLLEGAEAAQQDANLIRFLTGTFGATLEAAAHVLREFRGLREHCRRVEGPEAP